MCLYLIFFPRKQTAYFVVFVSVGFASDCTQRNYVQKSSKLFCTLLWVQIGHPQKLIGLCFCRLFRYLFTRNDKLQLLGQLMKCTKFIPLNKIKYIFVLLYLFSSNQMKSVVEIYLCRLTFFQRFDYIDFGITRKVYI